jgi:FixJ family two-component response regulator
MASRNGLPALASASVPSAGSKVHIIDDDASFRTALERRLRLAGYAVATYVTAEQFLDNQPDQNWLGCILLDVRLPGVSGPELQITVSTIKAGAEDFLTKPISAKQLLSAVERAIARHKASSELKIKADVRHARLLTLTPRQRQVFDLVVQGKHNHQIGRQLGATERTIKAHRHEVMEKMGVQSVAELVSMAAHLGVLSAG